MKKNPVRKLSLNRETLRGLDELASGDLRLAGGTATENTCFGTCNCKSGSCYWSECGWC